MPPEPPAEVELVTIICNPLAPAPSETATLTAQVSGSGGSADFEWSVSGGTLLENGAITVRWQVPEEREAYEVRVIARVGSAADTMTTYVLVRNFNSIPTGIRFSYYPNVVEGELFFVGAIYPVSDRRFLGYMGYWWADEANIITTNPSPPINGCFEFVFGAEGVLTSSVTGGSEFLRQQPINIIRFPLIAGTKTFVSNNDLGGSTFGKNQHIHPCPSPGMNMVVWQANIVGESEDGTKDRININFREGLTAIKRLTTSVDSVFVLGAWTYYYYRNIKPLFNPDASMIVYFVDSTETFEPCLIPMEGNQPILEERRALMVDSRHGIFFYAGVQVNETTVFQWNPLSNSQLFFIDGGSNFCMLDIEAETVEILAGGIEEFSFSEDGRIAAIADDGVYIAETIGGEPKRVFERERDSDDIFGVTWSPAGNNQRVVFRMVRKGASVAESFSALVTYSIADDRWYFASRRIPFGSEPTLPDYRWKRASFEAVGTGFIMPVPVSTGGGGSTLYRSS